MRFVTEEQNESIHIQRTWEINPLVACYHINCSDSSETPNHCKDYLIHHLKILLVFLKAVYFWYPLCCLSQPAKKAHLKVCPSTQQLSYSKAVPFLIVNVALIVAPIQPPFHRDSLGGGTKIIIVSLLIIAPVMNHTSHLVCQIQIVNEVMLREKGEKKKKVELLMFSEQGVRKYR